MYPGQRCAFHRQVDHMLSEIDINAERIPRGFQRGEVAVNPRRRAIRADISASARTVISGPTPHGSPMVMPMMLLIFVSRRSR